MPELSSVSFDGARHCVLANDSYNVMLSAAGSGFSRWRNAQHDRQHPAASAINLKCLGAPPFYDKATDKSSIERLGERLELKRLRVNKTRVTMVSCPLKPLPRNSGEPQVALANPLLRREQPGRFFVRAQEWTVVKRERATRRLNIQLRISFRQTLESASIGPDKRRVQLQTAVRQQD